ncbi:hypothetical protein OG900_09925 [Streptomyces sp. NBC_00433]
MSDQAWARLPEIIGYPGREFDLWDVETLVRLDGFQKAGARIIEHIEQQLAKNNIGHLPAKLPTDSTRQVLLYRKDVPGICHILSLVHQLATQDAGDGTNGAVNQLNSLLDGMTKVSRAVRAS